MSGDLALIKLCFRKEYTWLGWTNSLKFSEACLMCFLAFSWALPNAMCLDRKNKPENR